MQFKLRHTAHLKHSTHGFVAFSLGSRKFVAGEIVVRGARLLRRNFLGPSGVVPFVQNIVARPRFFQTLLARIHPNFYLDISESNSLQRNDLSANASKFSGAVN